MLFHSQIGYSSSLLPEDLQELLKNHIYLEYRVELLRFSSDFTQELSPSLVQVPVLSMVALHQMHEVKDHCFNKKVIWISQELDLIIFVTL